MRIKKIDDKYYIILMDYEYGYLIDKKNKQKTISGIDKIIKRGYELERINHRTDNSKVITLVFEKTNFQKGLDRARKDMKECKYVTEREIFESKIDRRFNNIYVNTNKYKNAHN